jgi:putative two-component system response regulator
MPKGREVIIMVDDNNTNLVACKKILQPYYDVYPAPSAAKMFKLLERITPHLILLDVEMPGTNGYEAARMLKGDEKLKDIPVIFLTARSDPVSERFGLNLGAKDYLHKPLESEVLLKRIGDHFSSSQS